MVTVAKNTRTVEPCPVSPFADLVGGRWKLAILYTLDHDGNPDPEAVLASLADELVADPEAFRRRRCETSTGAKIHPTVALRALLTGHVRRVVVFGPAIADHVS